MTIKVKYFLFIVLIHFLLAVLIYKLVSDQKMLFLLAEFGILFSLFLSYNLYRSFIAPLSFMAAGTDAIADKDFNVKFVKTGAPEMDKLVDVYNRMIDNIRDERVQIKEQHFFLEKLIQASPAGILILDYEGKLAEANPKAQIFLELEGAWRNQSLEELNHPLLNQVSGMEVGDSQVLTHNGNDRFKCEVSHFIHKGFYRKFILIQEMSKAILEAEKRAYGKVIRMMAHEVNNSIGAINSILNSTTDFFEDSESTMDSSDRKDVLEALNVAIHRNNSLNKFMRNFADVIRLPPANLQAKELNKVAQQIITLMEPQASNLNIKFETNLTSESIPCQLDEQQLEQVLVNVIKNAIESIGENGIIRFESIAHPKTLIISDNGPGISEETADKLFSPFFSTKVNGQGLGLTLIREILANHNATFSLKTEGEWTYFKIVFED